MPAVRPGNPCVSTTTQPGGSHAHVLAKQAGIDRKLLRIALGMHTNSLRYLKTMERARHRVDLAGNIVAEVPEEHRKHASEVIRERFKKDAERRRAQREAEVAERQAAAAERHPGGMRAVIKLDAAQVENLAAQAGEDCWPVNYNSPQQTVVAGAPEALQELDVLVKEAGGRAMKVAVSGAFHSPYMAAATCGLAAYIEAGHAPSPLLIPVLANMTAAPYPADPQTASDVLANQVSHAVRWVDTLHALQDQGIDTFIEVGPGKTLSGLVKRTLSDVRVYSCETAEQVAAIADELA